ncbi:hypothetical protein L228DRAFT_246305 [Xylona heveae TC161]|uniref:Uncharacterized protein n=1 Tax=Xylona heveae (strain CBS 132557 / TC161) TaxID=1328760 RepID=A0A165HHL7_XYLHT|nr:hypothetical protein L228DRAFT_246305 [Xylona heveae TC161]KZF23531.1 hypothetical protein L228DRAFT_246305 [Xylona heveae TC161]
MASSSTFSSAALERAQARLIRIKQILSSMELPSFPVHLKSNPRKSYGRRNAVSHMARPLDSVERCLERARRLLELLSNSPKTTAPTKINTTILNTADKDRKTSEQYTGTRRVLRTRLNEPVKAFWDSTRPTRPPAFKDSQALARWQTSDALLRRCREIQTRDYGSRTRCRPSKEIRPLTTRCLGAINPFQGLLPSSPPSSRPALRSCLKKTIVVQSTGELGKRGGVVKSVTFAEMEQVRWFYKAGRANGYIPRDNAA